MQARLHTGFETSHTTLDVRPIVERVQDGTVGRSLRAGDGLQSERLFTTLDDRDLTNPKSSLARATRSEGLELRLQRGLLSFRASVSSNRSEPV